MPNKTNIEWTDYTSNPIAPVGGGWGCSKVSPGCDHCYAERLNKWRGNKRDFQGRWKFYLKEKELEGLKRLNYQVGDFGTSTYVFLGDMTDIFHPDVPFTMLEELFAVLDECDLLTVQLLTKRPGRMAYFANQVLGGSWPPNVWAGTSVEAEWDGRRHLIKRLDLLAQVPAKVRFVSYEPALGPVDFTPWLGVQHYPLTPEAEYVAFRDPSVHWVITGGESGPGARPMHPAWVRSARDQCQAAGVAFFLKQWGLYEPAGYPVIGNAPWTAMPWLDIGDGFPPMVRLTNKVGTAFLDGREWREFPNA